MVFVRFLLGWLVCVSLLQMPLPIMHHHAAFSSEQRLAAHVEREHHGEFAGTEDAHWHLVLPRHLDRDGEHSHHDGHDNGHDNGHDDGHHDGPLDVAVQVPATAGSNSGSSLDSEAADESWWSMVVHGDRSHGDHSYASKRPTDRRCVRPLIGNVTSAVHALAVLCVIRV